MSKWARRRKFGIKMKRWPWQLEPSGWWNNGTPTKCGWFKASTLGRFGACCNWSLSIRFYAGSISMDLLFGILSIQWSELYEVKDADGIEGTGEAR